MVFSSIIFLFFFLPVALALYFLIGNRFRNYLLLTASLIFYAWGEGLYVLLMLFSIIINYLFGLLLDSKFSNSTRKLLLTFAIAANLGLLVFFKYANWLIEVFTTAISWQIPIFANHQPIHLPIGISFFTFQALSYVIDIYRQQTSAQRNPFYLGLYISSFPQLIAGPIVRYHDVSQQILSRRHSLRLFSSGVERFIYGLSKKVLIANPTGQMADKIFALSASDLSSPIAWLGIICYTLQIYFDFSGYSDMAIGLGRMFGFKFLENFNYPYISRSIKEFWRRWHISLSSWFRDYLYISLGGNRCGNRRTYVNLLLVFFLCGLWHGASWNFIVWGLIHGVFLILERGRLGQWLEKCPSYVCRFYTLFIVMNAWVFFRVEDISSAVAYLKVMYGAGAAATIHPTIALALDSHFLVVLITGIIFTLPVYPYLRSNIGTAISVSPLKIYLQPLWMSILLLVSCSFLANGVYNPFIYFRF